MKKYFVILMIMIFYFSCTKTPVENKKSCLPYYSITNSILKEEIVKFSQANSSINNNKKIINVSVSPLNNDTTLYFIEYFSSSYAVNSTPSVMFSKIDTLLIAFSIEGFNDIVLDEKKSWEYIANEFKYYIENQIYSMPATGRGPYWVLYFKKNKMVKKHISHY